MANTALKFVRKATAPSTPVEGMIWFNSTDGTIQLYKGTTWEKYAGKLNNATWDSTKNKLTITKTDGSSIELDFSDMASAGAVGNALSKLTTDLTNLTNRVTTAEGNIATVTNKVNDDSTGLDSKASKTEVSTLSGKVTTNTSDITTLKTKVDALSSATHFLGVREALPTAVEDKVNGNVVIVGQKEYIYAESDTSWHELGDTTAETARIKTLEDAVNHPDTGLAKRALQSDLTNLTTRVSTAESNITTIKGYKVNNKVITSNPVLNGADIALTGYAKGSTNTAVAAADTVNVAIGKLENQVDQAVITAAADATDKANTAKSEAIEAAATNTSTEVGRFVNKLIGDPNKDNSSSNTIYGAKKYADEKVQSVVSAALTWEEF